MVLGMDGSRGLQDIAQVLSPKYSRYPLQLRIIDSPSETTLPKAKLDITVHPHGLLLKTNPHLVHNFGATIGTLAP